MPMNDIMTYLINYALDHGISCMVCPDLPSHIPHSASAKNRKILINPNYGSLNELPFATAHELGHVLNGDTGIRYYQSASVHNKCEYQANLTGVRLLLKYCQSNDIDVGSPVNFCERFGIPTEYDYVISLLTRPNTDDVKSCNY